MAAEDSAAGNSTHPGDFPPVRFSYIVGFSSDIPENWALAHSVHRASCSSAGRVLRNARFSRPTSSSSFRRCHRSVVTCSLLGSVLFILRVDIGDACAGGIRAKRGKVMIETASATKPGIQVEATAGHHPEQLQHRPSCLARRRRRLGALVAAPSPVCGRLRDPRSRDRRASAAPSSHSRSISCCSTIACPMPTA